MQFGIIKEFFGTTVIIVVRGHVMEGTLNNLSHQYGEDVVGLTSKPPPWGLDGYVQSPIALVEVAAIDVIRPLITVVSG